MDNGEPDRTEVSGTVRQDVSLSVDALLSLLAHHHRRALLEFLVEAPNNTAALDDCVGYLIQQEEARVDERPAYDEVEAVLHHVHLPKLGNAGILEYDARSQQLRYWGHEQLEAWLARIQEETV